MDRVGKRFLTQELNQEKTMRAIEFKGRKKGSTEWIEGSLVRRNGLWYVFPENAPNGPNYYEVEESTVSQFTGLLDKNGVKIWEGDLVNGVAVLSDSYGYDSTYNITGVVKYDTEHSAFTFTDGVKHPVENYFSFLWQLDESKTEVIGNIHDLTPQVSKEGGETQTEKPE